MRKDLYLNLKNKLDEVEEVLNGGKGSGNFGHKGRPGEVGGSASEGSSIKGQAGIYSDSKADPYVTTKKSTDIGVNDYLDAGVNTSGNFSVDSMLSEKSLVESVKDHNRLRDIQFKALSEDKIDKKSILGRQISDRIAEALVLDAGVNSTTSATYRTTEDRKKSLRGFDTEASRLAQSLSRMRETAKSEGLGEYVDSTLSVLKRVRDRIDEASKSVGWQTHKTNKPDIAG